MQKRPYSGSDEPNKRPRTMAPTRAGRGNNMYQPNWQQSQGHGRNYSSGHTGPTGHVNSAVMREVVNYSEVVWPEKTRATKPACFLWYHLALATAMTGPHSCEGRPVEGIPIKDVGRLLHHFWDASVKQEYYYGEFLFQDPARLEELVKAGKCFKIHPIRGSSSGTNTWSVSLDKTMLQRWYVTRMALALWPEWRRRREHYYNFKLTSILVSDKHENNAASGRFSMDVEAIENPWLAAWSVRTHNIIGAAPPSSGAPFLTLLKERPECFSLDTTRVGNQTKHIFTLDVAKLKALYEALTSGWPSKVLLPATNKYTRAMSGRPGEPRSVALGFRPSRGQPKVAPSIDTMLREWAPDEDAATDAKAGLEAAADFGRNAPAAPAPDFDLTQDEQEPELVVEEYQPLDANAMVGDKDSLPVVWVEQAGSREWKSMCSHLYYVARSTGPRCVGVQALQDEDKEDLKLMSLIVPEETIPIQLDEDNNPIVTEQAPATIYVVPLSSIATRDPEAVTYFRRILEEEGLVMVVHGAKSWCTYLNAFHKFKLNNLVDLQVFHGWLTLLQQLSTTELFPEDRLSLNRAPLPELVRHYRASSTFLEGWRTPWYNQRDRIWGQWPPSANTLQAAASYVTPLLELYCIITFQYHSCNTIKTLTRADTLHAHLQTAKMPALSHGEPLLETLRATDPTTAAFMAAARSFAICPDGDRPPHVQLDLHFNEKCEAVVTLGSASRAIGPDRKDIKLPDSITVPSSTPAAAATAQPAAQPAPAATAAQPAAAAPAQPAATPSTAPGRGAGSGSTPAQNGPTPSNTAAGTPAPAQNGPTQTQHTPATPAPAQNDAPVQVKNEPNQTTPAGATTAASNGPDFVDLLSDDDEDVPAAAGGPTAEAAAGAAAGGPAAADANGEAADTSTGTGGVTAETAGATATANGSVAPPDVGNPETDTIDILDPIDMDPDVESLLKLIPPRVVKELINHHSACLQRNADPGLVEVMIDDGRPVQLKLTGDAPFLVLEDVELDISEAVEHLWSVFEEEHKASKRDLPDKPNLVEMAKILFRKENRLTYDRSLHRISAIRDDFDGSVIGLTYRIGRHVPGVAKILTDILYTLTRPHDELTMNTTRNGQEAAAKNTSLLLVGKPGSGKTTMLRDIAHAMANKFKRNTVVVDTSNEIAGDGRRPHPCIGHARRVSVLDRSQQHSVMLQTVQNHTPHVLMLDELVQEEDVKAAIEVSKRGVMMIATVHGNSLKSIVQNPELNPLLGGWDVVTLGDVTARFQNQGKKLSVERQHAAAFGVVVEVLSRNRFRIHPDASSSVDAILRNQTPPSHIRCYDADGTMTVELDCPAAATYFLPPMYTPDPMLPTLKKQISMLQQSSWLLELLRVNFLVKLQDVGQVEEESPGGPGATFRIGDSSMLDVGYQQRQADERRRGAAGPSS